MRQLDRRRPFATVVGQSRHRFEQDGIKFDHNGLEIGGVEPYPIREHIFEVPEPVTNAYISEDEPSEAIPVEPVMDQLEPEEPTEIDANGDGYVNMKEMRAELDRRGVRYNKRSSRAQLIRLLEGSEHLK